MKDDAERVGNCIGYITSVIFFESPSGAIKHTRATISSKISFFRKIIMPYLTTLFQARSRKKDTVIKVTWNRGVGRLNISLNVIEHCSHTHL